MIIIIYVGTHVISFKVMLLFLFMVLLMSRLVFLLMFKLLILMLSFILIYGVMSFFSSRMNILGC